MQQIVPCLKTTRVKTFPRYLMVKLGKYQACFFAFIASCVIHLSDPGRYYVGPNWVQVKINARVDVPEFLDLSGALLAF
jgi:hypothetical protein